MSAVPLECRRLSHKFIVAHETLVRLNDEGRLFGHMKRAIVHEALAYGEIAEGEVDLLDLRGEPRKVVVEAFCNQYLSLIMLTEKRASKTIGRRIDVRAG